MLKSEAQFTRRITRVDADAKACASWKGKKTVLIFGHKAITNESQSAALYAVERLVQANTARYARGCAPLVRALPTTNPVVIALPRTAGVSLNS